MSLITYYAVSVQRSYWPDLSASDENTHRYITDRYNNIIAVPTLDEAAELALNRVVSIIMCELDDNSSSGLVVNGLKKYSYGDVDSGGLLFNLSFSKKDCSEDVVTYTLSVVYIQCGRLYKQQKGN